MAITVGQLELAPQQNKPLRDEPVNTFATRCAYLYLHVAAEIAETMPLRTDTIDSAFFSHFPTHNTDLTRPPSHHRDDRCGTGA